MTFDVFSSTYDCKIKMKSEKKKIRMIKSSLVSMISLIFIDHES